MHDICQRAGRNQDDHDDDIGLHGGRRHRRGQRGKRIAGEHHGPLFASPILNGGRRRTQRKRLCGHRKNLAPHRVQCPRRCRLKICIVSDSHDHREPLAAAVAEAKALGAQAVLHCGDLVAPSTLHAIVDLGLPIHLIHGNNVGDLFYLSRFAREHSNRVQYYGQDGSLDLAQRRIFMVHYPHYAKAMALTGDYDLVCNGHEHRAVIERIRNVMGKETLRIDPGTVAGVSGPQTYVFGDLQTLEFGIRSVPP
ncbi:MAG TPA: metallophosphoesterase family protein [Burkholderiales bacterium]|nr:metallophosphoesterase family protein [Burkholderiales bacterium]